VLLATLFGVASCNTCSSIVTFTTEDISSIEHEIEQFHVLYNSDEFRRIYDNSSRELKEQYSEEYIENLYIYFKEKTGNFEKTTSRSFSIYIPVDQEIQYNTLKVIVEYHSEFSLNQVKETFVYDKINGKFLQSGYKFEFKNP
jgi:hypothetical protein